LTLGFDNPQYNNFLCGNPRHNYFLCGNPWYEYRGTPWSVVCHNSVKPSTSNFKLWAPLLSPYFFNARLYKCKTYTRQID
jgi:hypothetical protein